MGQKSTKWDTLGLNGTEKGLKGIKKDLKELKRDIKELKSGKWIEKGLQNKHCPTMTELSQFFLIVGSKCQRLNPQPWNKYFSCIKV